jgi:amidase
MERPDGQSVEGRLTRRAFLHRGAGMAVGIALSGLLYVPETWAAEAELSIADLQATMGSGQLTARALIQSYLERIEAVDRNGPTLRSVIETNPDLLAIADALDEERQSKGARGPLHGIPILLKDNIDTADRMMTTAGSFALVGDPPAQDATVARQLRDAGAILMGKANLSEWANFRSTNSSNGWSARGGQTRNPHVLNQDPCGSSSGSGVAVATNLCAASLGSETDGSITCPAAFNGVVGIKPTVGLLSRAGVIPIAHSQDTVGPMTRTVADAALLLGAMTGIDPRDAATQGSEGKSFADYTQFLNAGALKGARIGVPYGRGDKVTRAAIQVLEDAGAVLVTSRIASVAGVGDAEFQVLLYEFKEDLNRYLAGRTGVPVRSLEELIAFKGACQRRETESVQPDPLHRCAEEGTADGCRLPECAGEVPDAVAGSAGRGTGEGPARGDGGAGAERGHQHGRASRVPVAQRAGGVRSRDAGQPPVLRPRLQRGDAAGAGPRIRAAR